jgi:hypothetical protein
MAGERYINFDGKKFYDAKTFYETIKDHDGGIYFAGGFHECKISGGGNEKKIPKIFYVESNLPKFFCQRSFLYFPDNKKICWTGGDRSAFVDAIIIYEHGFIIFVFADKQKNRIGEFKVADPNIIHHKLVVEHFYPQNPAFKKLTYS